MKIGEEVYDGDKAIEVELEGGGSFFFSNVSEIYGDLFLFNCSQNSDCVLTSDWCGCKVGVSRSQKLNYDLLKDEIIRSGMKYNCMICDKKANQVQCIDHRCEAK